jgi:prolipoprotein diacylglyceryl transferase
VDPYVAIWAAGGALGTIGALAVLRARATLAPREAVALAVAWVAFVYGAKVQYRLAALPLLDALRVPPRALLLPGFNAPLGLLLAWMAGTIACVALRGSWRHMGDALAVAGATMLPIGRIACHLAGCCRGRVCPPWLALCPVPPRDGIEHARQVMEGLIRQSNAALPVHPLPAYFAAASLAILVVLLWQLRRGVRPGVMLATFGVLFPPTQMAIEPLRAAGERSPEAMTVVLLALLTAGLAVWLVVLGPGLMGRSRLVDARRVSPALGA